MLYGLPASVVKHYLVKGLDLFEKMFFDGEPQVAATIVVVGEIAGNGEDSARLLLQAGPDQGCFRKSSLVRMLQVGQIAGNAVQKAKVFRSVEDPVERSLDEVWAFAPRREQRFTAGPSNRRVLLAMAAVANTAGNSGSRTPRHASPSP